MGAERGVQGPEGAKNRTVTGSAAGVLRGRRRALPTGRAVVGGFLVALAAVVVFAAALSGTNRHERTYVVADQPLAAGTVITLGDLGTARMQLPSTSSALAFTQSGLLVGRALAIAVQPGELMQTSMLTPESPQSSLRPVTASVDPDSLATLTAGQKVDVLTTIGTGASTQVSVVMRGAVLVDIGRASSGVLSGPSSSVVVTLGVSSLAEVEAIVQAQSAGTVSLVAAEPSDGTGPGS
jgi:hypothetical protein